MADDRLCSINVSLLPIKAHFFLFYGAMGGVIPFIPVLAKGLGINATAVGLVYTALPFCVFFSKPLFGYLTDYLRNIKLTVFTLVAVTTVAYFAIAFIPILEDLTWTKVHLECSTGNKWLSVIPQDYNRICLQDVLKQGTNCELNYFLCDSNSSITLLGQTTIDDTKYGNITFSPSQYEKSSSIMLKFESDTNAPCNCVVQNSSVFRCPRPDVNSCFKVDRQSVYKSFQFWVFTSLVIIAGTSAMTVFSLSDAACYEVLGDRPENYGRQRLWATVSSGSVTFLAGLFNDIATGSSDSKNYSSGFYLMMALVIIDLVLLYKIKLTKANFSTNICQNILKIFSSCETVAFAISVYIIGGLTGLILNYQFWYLQDLGATQTLLGLTVAVRCLAAEVPFFYFTGWFIKKFGYFNCLTGSFFAFSLRFGLYNILENPWMVLPIEILHGVTFAVFYSAMTGYASDNAPPGAEATKMGILGGLFEGLGFASGSLLGGLGFDNLGGRSMFLVASIISFVCAPTLAIIHAVISRRFPKIATVNKENNTNCDGTASSKP